MSNKSYYKKEWEGVYEWIREVKGDREKAYCTYCNKTVKISGSGICQVKSHDKGPIHRSKKPSTSQQTLLGRSGQLGVSGGSSSLSPQLQAIKAEIYQILHMVEYNISFSSADEDNQQYRLMFPGHPAVEHYACASSKVAYVLKFGIAEHIRRELMADVSKQAYTFKFDESTTTQVKKQYDVYLCYWSDIYNEIVNTYAGTLYLGHCTAHDLVAHYKQTIEALNLTSSLLLHIGMDGPNVNLSFAKKLSENLLNSEGKQFIDLGTCSLHPVHTAFKCGLDTLSFDFEQFFNDISFFFKLSSARREDYKKIEAFTKVNAEFAKKFGATRWLGMKIVGVRCLEQYVNLKEYFLTFSLKQKGFNSTVPKTARYQSIKAVLGEPMSEAYIAFMVFAVQDFESFLRKFQYDQPMIHILYTSIVELIQSIMRKFVKKGKLASSENQKADEIILSIDVMKNTNCKSPDLIDIGTRSKVMFSDCTLFPDTKRSSFRQECLKFYQFSVRYLQHLPHNNNIIKHAQFLHPEKRNVNSSTSGISNLAHYVTKVVNIAQVFKMNGNKESVVDMIRHQWSLYQIEDIPESYYLNQEVVKPGVARPKSYWPYALEVCGLEEETHVPSKFKRIDHYWRSIGEITDDQGQLKYVQLFSLAKCVLAFSSGNATPSVGLALMENYWILMDTLQRRIP